MRIKFEKITFQPNKFYEGRIEDVYIDRTKGNVYIFVRIEKYKDETFLKSIPFSKNRNGQLARFLDELGLLEDDSAQLDDLCNQFVRVTMKRGKNKQWFVDEIEIEILEDLEDLEDEELGDDELDEDEEEEE